MLRSVFVASFALSATVALASPKVGDHAEYAATVTRDGKSAAVSAVVELVQQDGTKFLQRTTITNPGQPPKVSDEWAQTEDLRSDADIESALKTCAADGGTLQSITVPAGTFDTCAVTFDDATTKGTEWIGRVPFGTVRISYVQKADNSAVDMQLKLAH